MNDVAALPVYGTEFLLGAYGVIDTPKRFLLELAFPYEQTFETEKVAFDKVDRARRLAPFVSPNVQGKPMRQQGFQTKDFTPAYIKPKFVVDANRPLKRLAGERLLGAMNPVDRYNRVIVELMAEADNQISRREEWMAAQILCNGSVVVQGDDYPAMTVDFGRPAGQTIVLTGSNRWGQSGVSIMTLLRSWNRTVMLASGFNANIVVLDPSAEELFIADSGIQTILNNRVNTPNGGRFPVGNIQLGGVLAGAVGQEVKFLGYVGEFEVYVYGGTYVDDSGNVQPFLPANTCLMLSPEGVQGTRTYGAIRDARAGFRALPRFPKMWVEDDPSVTYLMTQAAPLPVLGWPEASLCATVN